MGIGGAAGSDRWAVSSPLQLAAGEGLQLHIFVDGNLIEVVANNRTSVVYAATGLTKDATAVRVFGGGADSTSAAAIAAVTAVSTFDAWKLGSIWGEGRA